MYARRCPLFRENGKQELERIEEDLAELQQKLSGVEARAHSFAGAEHPSKKGVPWGSASRVFS